MEQLKPGGVLVAPVGEARGATFDPLSQRCARGFGADQVRSRWSAVWARRAGGLCAGADSRRHCMHDARCALLALVVGRVRVAAIGADRLWRRRGSCVGACGKLRLCARRSSRRCKPAPDWAAGEGTPLSAYALQPNARFDPAQPAAHASCARRRVALRHRHALPNAAARADRSEPS